MDDKPFHGRHTSRCRGNSTEPSQREYERNVLMAKVQQRLALERHDLEQRVKEVRDQFRDIAKRKLIVQDEWKKVRIAQSAIRDDADRFERARRSSWFQAALLPTKDMKRIKLSVSGQPFECSVAVLKKDPDSMLAAIASEHAPASFADAEGCLYLDRDWWLFRHILEFLRHGKLPADNELLNKLYIEADFYKLDLLRNAIRDHLDPSRIVERSCTVPKSKLREFSKTVFGERRIDDSHTNSIKPNQFLFGLQSSSDTIMEDYGKVSRDAWWTKDTYKGKDYSSNSVEATKSVSNVTEFQQLHQDILNSDSNTFKLPTRNNSDLAAVWTEFENSCR